MDETFYATGGLPEITRHRPPTRLRTTGLVLTALLGSVVVVWASYKTWDRIEHLQQEFAGLKADSFYLGVRMKNGIQRMNDSLLRYRLHGDKADYDLFYTEGQALNEWFNQSRTNAATPLEHEFFEQIGGTYDEYLTESTNLLEANFKWFQTKVGAFPTSYEKVQNQSEHLLELCDSFIRTQRAAFDGFLADSKIALAKFRLMLGLSVALLLALIGALALMVYRGTIAPLKHQLTESQAIIARQEKLASLGVLAAGVAHEIRNPLTAIKFRLYSLKKSLADGADNEDAAVIGSEISRLERIVKDVLEFARPSEPELVAVPAQRMLEEIGALLKPQLERAAIELKIESSEPVWVRADTQQIKEVLINLVQNAADSIGRDGTVTLRVRDERNQHVAFDVADTGRGISPAVQKRLFDPFFTTKEGGTGLGLSIAARIIEKHGGELHYETQPNHGTTFSVVLPRIVEHERQDSAH